MSPMMAIQSIAVVNGRPTIWGDGALGLVQGSGLYEWHNEWFTGEGDALTAWCEVKRKGSPNTVKRSFSVKEAKQARLWDERQRVTKRRKDGATYEGDNDSPWYRFPKRMLQMRARVALRDGFADVLRGLAIREEVEDITRTVAPAIAGPIASSEPPEEIEHIEEAQFSETAESGRQTPSAQAAEPADAQAPALESGSAAAPSHDGDGIVPLGELLAELVDRLGHATTQDDVYQAYDDFGGDALFAGYEGDVVEVAREIRENRLDEIDRQAAAANARQAFDAEKAAKAKREAAQAAAPASKPDAPAETAKPATAAPIASGEPPDEEPDMTFPGDTPPKKAAERSPLDTYRSLLEMQCREAQTVDDLLAWWNKTKADRAEVARAKTPEWNALKEILDARLEQLKPGR